MLKILLLICNKKKYIIYMINCGRNYTDEI